MVYGSAVIHADTGEVPPPRVGGRHPPEEVPLGEDAGQLVAVGDDQNGSRSAGPVIRASTSWIGRPGSTVAGLASITWRTVRSGTAAIADPGDAGGAGKPKGLL
jgi:hypothetical protein